MEVGLIVNKRVADFTALKKSAKYYKKREEEKRKMEVFSSG